MRREISRGNFRQSLFFFFFSSSSFNSSTDLSLKLLVSEWAWFLSGLGDSRLLSQVPSTEGNAGAGRNCTRHDRKRDHSSGLSLENEASAWAKGEWVDGRGWDGSRQLSYLGDDRGKDAIGTKRQLRSNDSLMQKT